MSAARETLIEVLRKLDVEHERTARTPVASPPGEHRRLCVGLATYDDFDGAWFTVMSALMYHKEVADQLSFVVIDNHPEGPCSDALKALESSVPNLRYVPFSGYRGTAVRDLVFREANSDIVCCVDSHILLRPGALRGILDYFDAHPQSRDLLHGPMMTPDLTAVLATHMDPVWQNGMFGRWADGSKAAESSSLPIEIPMHGLALFACRREAWPGFNSRFRGFGGEEGYLHEKVRRGGGRVLSLNELGWVHRFDRPAGIPYRPNWTDRVRNYRIGWSELGWDLDAVDDHFRAYLGVPEQVEPMLEQVRREHSNAFDGFDAVFCLRTQPGQASAQLNQELTNLDVAWRVEWRPARELDSAASDVQWTLAWRDSIEAAQHRGYESVLLLADGADPDRSVESIITRLSAVLNGDQWRVRLLDCDERSDSPSTKQASPAAPAPTRPWVAVHRRAFAEILAAIPVEPADVQQWLECGHSVGQQVIDTEHSGMCCSSPNASSRPRA